MELQTSHSILANFYAVDRRVYLGFRYGIFFYDLNFT